MIYDLVGIGPEIVKTIGQVELTIKNKNSLFQIVPNDFPNSQFGIIGTSFLRQHQATLNFADITLNLNSANYDNSPVKIKLPARTKLIVDIPIKPTHLTTGYLNKIDIGLGIFLGEALVSKKGNLAKCFIINSTNLDTEISLPPIDLENIEEYTIIKPCARSGAHSPLSPEGQKEHSSRLKVVDLKDLNEEEK